MNQFGNTEDFSDDELGLGMLSNQNDNNSQGLGAISDSSSEASANLGNRNNFNMNRQQEDDARSTFSAAESEKSVSSYAGSDLTPEEEEKKKKTLLFKLKRLQKRGYHLSRAYNIDSPLEEIQAEVDTIKREANLEQGTKAAKRGLLFMTSALEWANNKYDPFDVMLDGWSGEVQEDVENGEYDEVMEELYDKYYDKVSMSPEMKLMMMVGGSALQFHVSNTVVKTMMGPSGANNLLKQNPHLKTEIMNAVNKSEMGQQMQAEMGMGAQQPRKEMNGPSDVDDILAELENEDLNASNNNNVMEKPGTVTIDGW